MGLPMNKCRVCGCEFFNEPLLQYINMPKAAQFLPDEKSLKNDTGVAMDIYQCSCCGLVQINNDPVPYYKEVIRAAAFSDEMKAFRHTQFDTFVRDYSLTGEKVIEIGCGRGEYLTIMKHAGVDAYGLEQSEESVMHCIANGLKVSKGFIENSSYTVNNAPFAAFFIMNFLEHLPDLNAVLIGISHNLTDAGIGLVEVPNFDMIVRNKLFSEFIIDHLFYFTKETLCTTLQRNGFEILDCKEVWHDYILSAVVKKRTPLDISQFHTYQTQLHNAVHEYIGRFKAKHIAIWGAGHQALALISLLHCSDNIKYVIDSAVFKQKKYTPATHIPIVSPDTLYSNPVDAIIIMTASYSDEVARTIRQKFDTNIKVAIVRDFGLEIVA